MRVFCEATFRDCLLHTGRMEWTPEYEIAALVAEVREAEARLFEALWALWRAVRIQE